MTRADLPHPTRARWQPTRLGLVDLFLYDTVEFRFRDGHLLLRGNNGTGKSKVLALTLPFLLDGSFRRRASNRTAIPPNAWNGTCCSAIVTPTASATRGSSSVVEMRPASSSS
jgi:hypothetical protein